MHRAERADALAAALAELLADPLADPFAAEVVAVPAKGVERWLTQRLSHRLGAGRAATASAPTCVPVAGAAGRRRRWPPPPASTADDDPWARPGWCGRCSRSIDALRGRAVVRRPRPATSGRRRPPAGPRRAGAPLRHGRQLAELFAGYGGAPPAMLRDWARGPRHDGAGGRCRPTWSGRRSCGGGCGRGSARRARPSGSPPRAPRCAPTRARSTCRRGCRCSGPPGCRPSTWPCSAALAAHRDVHLWLPHPSPALWDRVAGRPPAPACRRRRDDPTAAAARHPLLAVAGPRRPRAAAPAGRRGADAVHRHHPRPIRRRRCSAGCSAGLRDDRPPRRRRPAAPPDDRSVQVHACHGPAPPGRGAARGAPRAARRRPDAGAARRRSSCARTSRRSRRWSRRPSGCAEPTVPPAIPGTGCGSGSPTGRCARPTRCSTRWPRCSSSPTPGSPPRRCSTCWRSAPVRRRFRLRRRRPGAAARRWLARAGVRWGLDAAAPRARSG